MVALRGKSWPYSASTPKASRPQSTPTSPGSKPSSIAALIPKIELQQEASPLVSLDGDRRSTPAFRPFASFCTGYHTVYPLPSQHSAGTMQHLTTEEEATLYASYARLPTPPEGSGEDIGIDINPHLPPSPVARAVDAAADDDDLADLPSIPDTPLGISQFEFGNRASFNTDMQDLVQSYPDTPIGGTAAAPMRRSIPIVSNGNMCDGRVSPLTPRIEITSPPGAPNCYRPTPKRPLIARSNFSDPFNEFSRAQNQSARATSPRSDKSIPMVTAPESPRARLWSHSSDILVPETDFCESAVRDFGGEADVSHMHAIGNLDGLEGTGCCDSPPELPMQTAPPLPSAVTNKEEFCPGPELCPMRPNNIKDVLPKNPQIPGASNIPAGRISTSLPFDATGMLAAPCTPSLRKSAKQKSRVKKGIRKSRSLLLRKSVLCVVVGRQLAGPTKDLLKAISEGTPMSVGVSRVGSIAPGVPPLPAPIPA